jgi:hypothetical protein
MKYTTTLLVLLVLHTRASIAEASSPRDFLSESVPVANEAVLIGTNANSPLAKSLGIDLIHQQLEAIFELSGQVKTGDVSILVPFLDYTDKPFALVSIGPVKSEDIQTTLSTWPVLHLLATYPNSADELKDYVSNKRLPLNRRLMAWLALRYINQDEFNKVGRSLQSEKMNLPEKVQNYMEKIAVGSVQFPGVENLNSL